MPVQDDERERELVRMFNLDWDPAHQRAGVDAILDIDVDGRPCRFEVEVKSSTGMTVSTARDVGMDHIQKWRRRGNELLANHLGSTARWRPMAALALAVVRPAPGLGE